jgi:hypothetical protein
MNDLEAIITSLFSRSPIVVAALLCVCCPASQSFAASRPSGTVIVTPKFGGQILGYAIDPTGTEGVLSESVNLSNGNVLAATEIFDQSTGQILNVVAETQSQDDFATQGVFAQIGLVQYQHKGQNYFLKINPLDVHKFNGVWKPPIMPGYQLWAISADEGTPNVAAYQLSFDAGLTYVFSSNIATNTFGPQISLASIIDVDEFFQAPDRAKPQDQPSSTGGFP